MAGIHDAGRRASSTWRVASLLVSTALGASLAIVSAAMAQPARVVHVDIPAEPLDAAIRAFIRATGLQVAYPAALSQGKQSAAVLGNYPPGEALTRLLARTGLTYRFVGATTVTLEAPAAATNGAMALPAVQVQGQSQNTLQSPYGPGVGYLATQSVTGMKTDTPLLETPQAVSVITRRQMDDQGVRTVDQALRYTAGVVSETDGAQQIFDNDALLRGFQPDQYLNGLKVIPGEFGVGALDTYFFDRIEVLHGPASVLYGQGTPGGIVALTSKLPTEQPYHEVELSGGSYGHVNTGFDLSGPVPGSDQLLYRLTGVGLTTGSQVDKTHQDRIGIAPALTWRPDNDTTLTVFGQYQNDSGPLAYAFIPAEGTVLPNPNGAIPTNLFIGDRTFDKYRRSQAQIGYMLEHRFDDTWTFRQNFRYQYINSAEDNLFESGFEPDLATLDRYAYSDYETLNAVTLDNQVQASFATGPLNHTVLFGVDYQWSSLRQRAQFNFTAPSLNVFAPVYGLAIPPVSAGSNYDAYETQDQVGLYLQDRIRLGRWTLLLGGRQDWAGTTTKDYGEGTTTPQSSSAFTYRAGLVYRFDDGLAPYASYTTSFSPAIGTDFSGHAFTPTTGQQYEVGVRAG